ncbi:tyrosine-type recombinase/integrase [Vallitalea pronyensis]|uniref:Tyrosine-type recombinase/integrase n=1 Tax=Vallitalea pronyensis TaxID=1348613 RepID=A0A8J8MNK7_9FIRM|nr:tyrosine-type recombinase/integrase [Vallitalea pronyensis]QUI24856.1 tyrosine-type recombinase/integrase [Vallitalea pronyensis]
MGIFVIGRVNDINITLKQAYELFLLEKESNCSEKTVKNYKNDIRYFIEWITKDRDLNCHEIYIDTIDLIDIKRYVVMLRKRPKLLNHHMQPTENKPITSTTIRTYSRHIKVFFNFLYQEEYMEKEIMKRFKMIKEERKAIVPLSADEVKSIDNVYNSKTKSGLRNLCIMHLMLDEGLRVSEVVRLRICDFMYDKNLLFIRASKGNKERYVTLSPNVKRMLYKYLILYRAITDEQLSDLNRYEEDALLLGVRENKPITQNVIKQLFARLKSKVKISRLKPHLLRHTFATSYILGGGDISSLRLLLGHSDIKVTEKYLHMSNTLFLTAGKDNIYRLDKVYFKRYYDTFST